MIISLNQDLPFQTIDFSADAHTAFMLGDTLHAQNLRRKAAQFVENEIAKTDDISTKHLLRFLAATQYYLGGLYQEAQQLTRKIHRTQLPSQTLSIFEQFCKDVKDRATSDYLATMRKRLLRNWRTEKYNDIVVLFQDHPYVIPTPAMAFVRACCFELLGDFDAARLFCADAVEFAPDNLEILFVAASIALRLAQAGYHDDAWTHLNRLHAATTNSALFLVNSLMHFQKVCTASDGQVDQSLYRKQLANLKKARKLFDNLSAKQQKNEQLRQWLALAYFAAALIHMRSGNMKKADEARQTAVEFSPAIGHIEKEEELLHKLMSIGSPQKSVERLLQTS